MYVTVTSGARVHIAATSATPGSWLMVVKTACGRRVSGTVGLASTTVGITCKDCRNAQRSK